MHNSIRYTLSNEGLKNGDMVYPIAHGRILENGGFILHDLWFDSFPYNPHKILDMKYSTGAYEVRTDHGYGTPEKYFKILAMEKREIEYYPSKGLKLKSRDEWVEIPIEIPTPEE